MFDRTFDECVIAGMQGTAIPPSFSAAIVAAVPCLDLLGFTGTVGSLCTASCASGDAIPAPMPSSTPTAAPCEKAHGRRQVSDDCPEHTAGPTVEQPKSSSVVPAPAAPSSSTAQRTLLHQWAMQFVLFATVASWLVVQWEFPAVHCEV